MTGRWSVLALAALFAATLAGCSGAPSAADLQAAPPALAAVWGVVVDEAIRPVADAVVTVPAVPAARATTAENGTFVLTGLAPGVVLVQVEKGGYLSTTAQLQARPGPAAEVAKIVLTAAVETQPYIVQESYDGFLNCGFGSQPVFGLTAPCETLAGAGLAFLCNGQDPIPPAGVCIDETNPYYPTQAQGNMSMAQTELTWDATVDGAQLMVVQWAVDGDGQLIRGIASATGPSYLVSRLNSTLLREYDIGGANSLSLYVSVGNAGPAVLVVQQSYRVFHTTAYYFEFEPEWVFIEDGAPILPPTCTTCLLG